MRPFFCRVGSKRKYDKALISLFPAHHKYVEAFLGGGAVFWRKSPSEAEVINDLDSKLVADYRRILSAPTDLSAYPLPKTEAAQNAFLGTSHTGAAEGVVESLLRRCNGFGGRYLEKGDKVAKVYRDGGVTTHESKLKNIGDYKNRLKSATLTSETYESVFRKHDAPDTFFFLDPPYEMSKGIDYAKGSETFDFEAFASALRKLKGKFLVTINDSRFIRKVMKGFNIYAYTVVGHHSEVSGIGAKDRKELLVSNYALPKQWKSRMTKGVLKGGKFHCEEDEELVGGVRTEEARGLADDVEAGRLHAEVEASLEGKPGRCAIFALAALTAYLNVGVGIRPVVRRVMARVNAAAAAADAASAAAGRTAAAAAAARADAIARVSGMSDPEIIGALMTLPGVFENNEVRVQPPLNVIWAAAAAGAAPLPPLDPNLVGSAWKTVIEEGDAAILCGLDATGSPHTTLLLPVLRSDTEKLEIPVWAGFTYSAYWFDCQQDSAIAIDTPGDGEEAGFPWYATEVIILISRPPERLPKWSRKSDASQLRRAARVRAENARLAAEAAAAAAGPGPGGADGTGQGRPMCGGAKYTNYLEEAQGELPKLYLERAQKEAELEARLRLPQPFRGDTELLELKIQTIDYYIAKYDAAILTIRQNPARAIADWGDENWSSKFEYWLRNPRKFWGSGHRERVLKTLGLPLNGYSLDELAKAADVPKSILQEVYNRGIGAYKTNPTSVRMKGSFEKGVDAPMSQKLSKEQWAQARVYSFLDGNAKHDQDLRGEGRGKSFEDQLGKVGYAPMTYIADVRKKAKAAGYDPKMVGFANDGVHKLEVHTPDGRTVKFGRVGYGDFLIWTHMEKRGEAPKGVADTKRKVFRVSHSAIRGKWRSDRFSPNNLALAILW